MVRYFLANKPPFWPLLLVALVASIIGLYGLNVFEGDVNRATAGVGEAIHPVEQTDINTGASGGDGWEPPTLPAVTTASSKRVLLLVDADTAGTTGLVNALTAAGNTVTRRAAPEYTWNGSNPPLTDIDVVIHLNGATFSSGLPVSAQTALVDFVRNGGGFVAGQWNGYERVQNRQQSMLDLVLHTWGDHSGNRNCGGCDVIYTVVAGQETHPVLVGIPSSFTFFADGHDTGSQVVYSPVPSTVIMTIPSGRPGVIVREFGNGCVVNFSHAANYHPFTGGLTLQDSNIQQLYANAVAWDRCGNQAPEAHAGTVQTVEWAIGGAAVTLDGSGSSDPDGDTLTYAWSAGAGVSFDTGRPGVIVREFGNGCVVNFSHAANYHPFTGGLTLQDSNIQQLYANAVAWDRCGNQAPEAHAGTVQTVEWAIGGAAVTLDGSGSSDPDGDTLTYAWSAGAGVSFDNPASATPTVTFSSLGTFVITLTVDDGNGKTDTATVTNTVVDTTPPEVTAALVCVGEDDGEHGDDNDCEDDEGRFRIEFSCSDACDETPEVTGVIETPSLGGLDIELKTSDKVEVKFDLEDGEVKIQGPDPEALLAQLQQYGGLVVNSGQEVKAELEIPPCIGWNSQLLHLFC